MKIFIALILLFLLSSCNSSEISAIKKEVKEIYGNKIDNISVNPLLKEDGYQIIVDLADEDKLMEVSQKNPKYNTYVKDHWTDWMKNESDRIVKHHFGEDFYCSKVYITSDGYTEYMPGDKVTPYDEFYEKYGEIKTSYIVFKSSNSSNKYSKRQFFELATELKNTGLRFGEITFFFEEDSVCVNIPYQYITNDFNEFSIEKSPIEHP